MAGTFSAAVGERRCSAHNRRGEQCRKWALKGATVCATHGGSVGRVRAAAQRREGERRALELAGRMHLDLPAFNGDPAAAIGDALRRAHEMVARLGRLVDGIEDGSLRYQGRTGEQLRGEVTAYQGALRDLVGTADKMLRLRLGDRMATAREVSARAHAQIAETEDRLADACVTAMQMATADVLLRYSPAIPEPMRSEMAGEFQQAISRRLRMLALEAAGPSSPDQ